MLIRKAMFHIVRILINSRKIGVLLIHKEILLLELLCGLIQLRGYRG